MKRDAGKKARKIKWTLSTLPLISIIDDIYKGVAGYYVLEKNIRKNPNNPLNWIFYFEAAFAVKTLRSIVMIFRFLISPFAVALGKTLKVTLNYMDDEYRPRDEEELLNIPMSLLVKKINMGTAQPLDHMLIGRIYYYKSIFSWIKSEPKQRRSSQLDTAMKYFIHAIETEENNKRKAEYLYYLAEVYREKKDKEMQYRVLNLSRKLGFNPAVFELFRLLRKDEVSEATLKPMFKIKGEINRYSFKFINDNPFLGIYYLVMYVITNQYKKVKLFAEEAENNKKGAI